MKQILQNLKNGRMELVDVPCPALRPGHLLIRSRVSLVSAGTERMLVEFGKANYIQKARQQPDKVRQVVEKVRTDGLGPTVKAVRSKLDEPVALGYSNVGVVIEAGGEEGEKVSRVDESAGLRSQLLTFSTSQPRAGDRVVSNGPHAEVVCVPKNLCAKVPDGVSDEEAAFTVLAAIGLQGVRLAEPTLGECFAVIGLGLIGLLTVQILRANGCRVLGIDIDAAKCELAQTFGAEVVDLSKREDPVAAGMAFSRGRGMDGVLITAATKSSEPVHQAALMCRKRGRIVLVGVTGLELSRDDFYKKELSFQVSCSYGPGRYDPEYEEKGHDYPVGYVRWTEQRNFEAVLDMMAAGKIDVKPLISHRFSIEEAEKAYEILGGKEPCLGILLEYRGSDEQVKNRVELTTDEHRWTRMKEEEIGVYPRSSAVEPVVGFIGAGNYAGRILMPAFKKAGAVLHTVASRGGVSAVHYGKKLGFKEATTDAKIILANDAINAVVIATRHDSHAELVIEALKAGKHVFVEKPLCLSEEELEKIIATADECGLATDQHGLTQTTDQHGLTQTTDEHGLTQMDGLVRRQSRNRINGSVVHPVLMVGFNRRFAPQVRKMKELLDSVQEPKSFIMTVNAGKIPADHWVQDLEVGGGRIIGEACHFVDLLRFLVGSPICGYHSCFLGNDGTRDKASLTLMFEDGSVATIHYLASGHKAVPKERLEVFCAGRVLQLNNFRKLRGYGWPRFRRMNLWRQHKGQEACAAAFVKAVRDGGSGPIPFDEIVEVSRVTIKLAADEHR